MILKTAAVVVTTAFATAVATGVLTATEVVMSISDNDIKRSTTTVISGTPSALERALNEKFLHFASNAVQQTSGTLMIRRARETRWPLFALLGPPSQQPTLRVLSQHFIVERANRSEGLQDFGKHGMNEPEACKAFERCRTVVPDGLEHMPLTF